MPARKSLRGATRRRGASRRWAGVPFDRWLDRLVDIAVATALLVGGTAMVVTLL